MATVIKIILFLIKAETVAIGLWLIMCIYDIFTLENTHQTTQIKLDYTGLKILSVLAIFATMIYIWVVA